MVLPGGPGGGSVFGSLSQMNSAVVPPFPAHLRPSSAPASERDVSPGRSLHQQQLSRSGIPSLEGRAASEVANSRDQGSANRSRAASPSRLSEESQGVHGQQPLWVPALPHKIKVSKEDYNKDVATPENIDLFFRIQKKKINWHIWLLWIATIVIAVAILCTFIVLWQIGTINSLENDTFIEGNLEIAKQSICTDVSKGFTGIGKCSPQKTLDVQGGALTLAGLPTANANNVGFAFSGLDSRNSTGMFAEQSSQDPSREGDLAFFVNGNDVLRLTQNASPNNQLLWHAVLNGSLYSSGDTLALGRQDSSVSNTLSQGSSASYGLLRALQVVTDGNVVNGIPITDLSVPPHGDHHQAGARTQPLHAMSSLSAVRTTSTNSSFSDVVSATRKTLHINFLNDFGGGVRIGKQDIVVAQPANTLVGGFVGIGIKVPKRQLHVRGGLFASVGTPSANVGYSFEEHSGSGLFASQEGGSSSNTPIVRLFHDGVEGLRVSADDGVGVRGELSFLLSSSTITALRGTASALLLNPSSGFPQVTTQSSMLVDPRLFSTPGLVSRSALDVVGGVRSSPGSPTSGPTSNVGFSFSTEGHTGMFKNDQDDRLEFFHQGTMVHSESDTVFMMGVPELSFWNLPDNEAESLTALLSVPSVHMPSRKDLEINPSAGFESVRVGQLLSVTSSLNFTRSPTVLVQASQQDTAAGLHARLSVDGGLLARPGVPTSETQLSGLTFSSAPLTGFFGEVMGQDSELSPVIAVNNSVRAIFSRISGVQFLGEALSLNGIPFVGINASGDGFIELNPSQNAPGITLGHPRLLVQGVPPFAVFSFDGTIRSRSGAPSLTHHSGFTFVDEDPGTGVFLVEDGSNLSLFTKSTSRLQVLHDSNRISIPAGTSFNLQQGHLDMVNLTAIQAMQDGSKLVLNPLSQFEVVEVRMALLVSGNFTFTGRGLGLDSRIAFLSDGDTLRLNPSGDWVHVLSSVPGNFDVAADGSILLGAQAGNITAQAGDSLVVQTGNKILLEGPSVRLASDAAVSTQELLLGNSLLATADIFAQKLSIQSSVDAISLSSLQSSLGFNANTSTHFRTGTDFSIQTGNGAVPPASAPSFSLSHGSSNGLLDAADMRISSSPLASTTLLQLGHAALPLLRLYAVEMQLQLQGSLIVGAPLLTRFSGAQGHWLHGEILLGSPSTPTQAIVLQTGIMPDSRIAMASGGNITLAAETGLTFVGRTGTAVLDAPAIRVGTDPTVTAALVQVGHSNVDQVGIAGEAVSVVAVNTFSLVAGTSVSMNMQSLSAMASNSIQLGSIAAGTKSISLVTQDLLNTEKILLQSSLVEISSRRDMDIDGRTVRLSGRPTISTTSLLLGSTQLPLVSLESQNFSSLVLNYSLHAQTKATFLGRDYDFSMETLKLGSPSFTREITVQTDSSIGAAISLSSVDISVQATEEVELRAPLVQSYGVDFLLLAGNNIQMGVDPLVSSALSLGNSDATVGVNGRTVSVIAGETLQLSTPLASPTASMSALSRSITIRGSSLLQGNGDQILLGTNPAQTSVRMNFGHTNLPIKVEGQVVEVLASSQLQLGSEAFGTQAIELETMLGGAQYIRLSSGSLTMRAWNGVATLDGQTASLGTDSSVTTSAVQLGYPSLPLMLARASIIRFLSASATSFEGAATTFTSTAFSVSSPGIVLGDGGLTDSIVLQTDTTTRLESIDVETSILRLSGLELVEVDAKDMLLGSDSSLTQTISVGSPSVTKITMLSEEVLVEGSDAVTVQANRAVVQGTEATITGASVFVGASTNQTGEATGLVRLRASLTGGVISSQSASFNVHGVFQGALDAQDLLISGNMLRSTSSLRLGQAALPLLTATAQYMELRANTFAEVTGGTWLLRPANLSIQPSHLELGSSTSTQDIRILSSPLFGSILLNANSISIQGVQFAHLNAANVYISTDTAAAETLTMGHDALSSISMQALTTSWRGESFSASPSQQLVLGDHTLTPSVVVQSSMMSPLGSLQLRGYSISMEANATLFLQSADSVSVDGRHVHLASGGLAEELVLGTTSVEQLLLSAYSMNVSSHLRVDNHTEALFLGGVYQWKGRSLFLGDAEALTEEIRVQSTEQGSLVLQSGSWHAIAAANMSLTATGSDPLIVRAPGASLTVAGLTTLLGHAVDTQLLTLSAAASMQAGAPSMEIGDPALTNSIVLETQNSTQLESILLRAPNIHAEANNDMTLNASTLSVVGAQSAKVDGNVTSVATDPLLTSSLRLGQPQLSTLEASAILMQFGALDSRVEIQGSSSAIQSGVIALGSTTTTTTLRVLSSEFLSLEAPAVHIQAPGGRLVVQASVQASLDAADLLLGANSSVTTSSLTVGHLDLPTVTMWGVDRNLLGAGALFGNGTTIQLASVENLTLTSTSESIVLGAPGVLVGNSVATGVVQVVAKGTGGGGTISLSAGDIQVGGATATSTLLLQTSRDELVTEQIRAETVTLMMDASKELLLGTNPSITSAPSIITIGHPASGELSLLSGDTLQAQAAQVSVEGTSSVQLSGASIVVGSAAGTTESVLLQTTNSPTSTLQLVSTTLEANASDTLSLSSQGLWTASSASSILVAAGQQFSVQASTVELQTGPAAGITLAGASLLHMTSESINITASLSSVTVDAVNAVEIGTHLASSVHVGSLAASGLHLDTVLGASLLNSSTELSMQSSTIMLGTLQNSTADTITIGNANGTSLLALNSFDTQISGQATVGQLLFVKGFCIGCNSGASDMRLKTDVHSLEGSSVLDRLTQLRPVSYKWNHLGSQIPGHSDHKTEFGFLAQEVEALFPELVGQVDSSAGKGFQESWKFLQYDRFAPLLVQGLQEHKKQSEEADRLLSRRLDSLENTVQVLLEQIRLLQTQNAKLMDALESSKVR